MGLGILRSGEGHEVKEVMGLLGSTMKRWRSKVNVPSRSVLALGLARTHVDGLVCGRLGKAHEPESRAREAEDEH